MKLEGLDRVIVFVRDLDSATAFFSGVLGIEFDDLPPDDGDGCLVKVSLDHQIELMALDPGSSAPPPHVARWAEQLERGDYVVVGLSFRVRELGAARDALHTAGFEPGSELAFEDMAPLPIHDVRELFLRDADTGGVSISFIQYREEKGDG